MVDMGQTTSGRNKRISGGERRKENEMDNEKPVSEFEIPVRAVNRRQHDWL